MEFLFGFSLSSWLMGIVVAIFLYYRYNSNKQNFWTIRNVPSAKRSIFDTLAATLKKQTNFELDVEQYKNYGRIFVSNSRRCNGIFISDPELLRIVLTKDFSVFSEKKIIFIENDLMKKMISFINGEDWKRIRMIFSPIFTSAKIKRFANFVNTSSEIVVDSLQKSADSATNVDVKKLFGAFVLDVIASTAFGTDMDSINNPDNAFSTTARAWFTFNWRIIFTVVAPKICSMLNISLVEHEAIDYFRQLVLKIREQRLQGEKGRNDFLQLLIDAEMEAYEDGSKRKTLSTDELVAQCIVFLTGGFETTATTFALFLYNMALHEGCQEKLLKEVDETWEEHGMVDFDVVNNMKYLDAAISETLRIYPPITRINRRSMTDYIIADSGITIPKGINVFVPVYAMHHDPEFFPDPEVFDPDRFLPENKHLIKPYTYLPFGTGPRSCVATKFALMELKLCIANVLRHVSFHICSETKVPFKSTIGSHFLQPTGVILAVKRRF